MVSYILRRLALAMAVAFTVSIVSFMLLRLSGDLAAALAGESASAQDIEFVRKKYGLDRPLVIQYVEWASLAVRGDFGESAFFKKEVKEILSDRIWVTLGLGGMALCFAAAVAIPLGVAAAVKPNSWLDRLALTIAVFGQAMPSFWFALVLIIVFGVNLRWFPISGSESPAHMVMPAVALGYYATPAIMRLTRAGMLEVLASDYIRTARAKGLRPVTVLFKHGLRNAIIPVVSLASVQFGFMLGGSVVIETVFAIHGVGFLAWESIRRSDLPVVQAIVLMLSIIYVLLTLFSDILNAALDPRIRIH